MTGFSSWSSYCTVESILGHYTAKLMKKGQVDSWSFDDWSFLKSEVMTTDPLDNNWSFLIYKWPSELCDLLDTWHFVILIFLQRPVAQKFSSKKNYLSKSSELKKIISPKFRTKKDQLSKSSVLKNISSPEDQMCIKISCQKISCLLVEKVSLVIVVISSPLYFL